MYLMRDTFPEIESGRKVTKVAVIGIGQSLRGDDGLGLEVLRQWREKFQETASRHEVQSEACELPGLALLDLLNDVDTAILVDAVQGQAAPGTIHLLNESELSAFTSDAKSAHGWGLAETLQLGNELRATKTKVKVVGIQAEQMTMGAGLSKAVKDAIPIACEVLEEEVHKILCE
jgi:hydrogenase maturation protease